ncbi:MAG: branched-chain amino acid ABC transporter permease [Verrucomicrobiae bacterium]|nr:branched-chain amino acid ABC transporter permease [Verrucomicrobiae bacterium]
MKVFWQNNMALLVVLLVVAAAGFGFQRHLDPYYYKILVDVGIAIILVVSLNLINGITGQFSLGHAGFMAVGAYASAALSVLAAGPWLNGLALGGAQKMVVEFVALGVIVIVGGVAAALAGFVVGMPALRLRGDYLAIATLGFGEIIRIVFQNTEQLGGARGISIPPPRSDFTGVYVCAVLCVAFIWRLVHSVKGKSFFAIREDEFAAATVGIDTTKYKVIAFVLGSFFAGVAGALFAHSATGYITPAQFDAVKSIELVVMVVLGGLGSISGSIIAAAALTLLPEILRGFAEYRLVVYSLLLVLVMLTRPQGLMGMKEIKLPWHRQPYQHKPVA